MMGVISDSIYLAWNDRAINWRNLNHVLLRFVHLCCAVQPQHGCKVPGLRGIFGECPGDDALQSGEFIVISRALGQLLLLRPRDVRLLDGE